MKDGELASAAGGGPLALLSRQGLTPAYLGKDTHTVATTAEFARVSTAAWEGDLQSGRGTMRLGSGAFEGPFSFKTRMGNEAGTNPEELIGAAHAGCFSMALSAGLAAAGSPPRRIETKATVHFGQSGAGWGISSIALETRGDVPGIDQAAFERFAEDAKRNCPVSKALSAVPISLKATLA